MIHSLYNGLDKFTNKEINIGNQRMLKLADFMQRLSPKKFDIDSWITISQDDEEQKKLRDKDVRCQLRDETCGTSGCVAGWMPIVFPRLLQYRQTSRWSGINIVEPKSRSANEIAGAIVLYLSEDEADELFLDEGYDTDPVTPKDVAKKLRKMVAMRQAVLAYRKAEKE